MKGIVFSKFIDMVDEKFSIEKDFFEKHFNDGVFLGKPCSNYFIDIGIPEDYARAKQEFLQMF